MMLPLSPIKVVIISPLPDPIGGIANWSQIVLGAVKSKENIEIVHLDTAVRWRSQTDHRINNRILGGTIQAVRDIFRVVFILIKTKPNLLHLCTSGNLATPKDVIILSIAKIFGVKSIIHFHMGRIPNLMRNNLLEWKLIRLGMLLADSVILLDKESEKCVNKSLPKINAQRVSNPIDIRKINEIIRIEKPIIKSKTIRLIYVGQVLQTKGIIELVKACGKINTHNIALSLVGKIENKFKDELIIIAENYKDGRWLQFLGALEWQVAMEYIRDADLFILPSYSEGFPNVILEAMALGKPIIATRVGAIPEMLDEELEDPCGLVIAPLSVQELYDALQYLLNNPEKASLYGKRAQQKVNRYYSIDEVIEEYVKIWQSTSN